MHALRACGRAEVVVHCAYCSRTWSSAPAGAVLLVVLVLQCLAQPVDATVASPCAAALSKLCNSTQGKGAVCEDCLQAHHAQLAPCYVPGSKCDRERCLVKFCHVPTPPAPPSPHPSSDPQKMCFNASGDRGFCGKEYTQCLASEPAGAPQFHIRDLTCGTSDVNAPFRDTTTGYWHVFYQNLLLTNKSIHRAKVWGHVVSKDGSRWSRMPVALWPDQPYDNTNVFSGSAVIVDGQVKLIYPGLWSAGPGQPVPGKSGRDLALAEPALDASIDPLYTEWKKLGTIVNNTLAGPLGVSGSDPSSAWQTPSKEWRFTTAGAMVTGSMDFKEWYQIGIQVNFTHSADPSFFPLPSTTPGAGPPPPNTVEYTHVYKTSVASPGGYGFIDSLQVGVYKPGVVRANSTWLGEKPQVIDHGGNYATSKDFYDEKTGRRILWGNLGAPPNGALSLPRELTWHPALQQLIYSPLMEQTALRGTLLGRHSNILLGSVHGAVMQLFDTGKHGLAAGLQSEAEVTFALPQQQHNAVFGVTVLGGNNNSSATSEGLFFFVNYTGALTKPVDAAAPYYEVAVGAVPVSAHAPPAPPQHHKPWPFPRLSTLRLLPSDTSITMTVFTDHTVAECFFQHGRSTLSVVATEESGKILTRPGNGAVGVMSVPSNAQEGADSQSDANATLRIENASVWSVNSIWV